MPSFRFRESQKANHITSATILHHISTIPEYTVTRQLTDFWRMAIADMNLNDLLLNGMTVYGPAILGSALLLGGVGVPMPGTLLVLAAGGLARQGVIDWGLALIVGLLGVVLGDSINYAIGRFARGWAQRQLKGSDAEMWRKAQNSFEHGGGLAIYSTRFLLTPLAVPTNLLAGGSGYGFGRFLTYDVAGEATWLLLYGGLGYTFGSQWQVINQVINDYSSWLVPGVMVGVGIYLLVRRQRRSRLSAMDDDGRGGLGEYATTDAARDRSPRISLQFASVLLHRVSTTMWYTIRQSQLTRNRP